MKLKTLVPVLALAVLLSIPTLASARKVHDFTCDYCHKASMVLDDIATVICLDCHTTGHEGDTFALALGTGFTNPIGNAVFVKGDASDAMGASTGQGILPVKQNSHSWGAGDINPAAGASAPTNPLFFGRSNYTGATVACGRCHDPHADNTDVWGPGTANPKLLKLGPDGKDAMCVDCHTAWNTSNADAFLTHPLIADYPGFQAANSDKYQPFTPDGTMALSATGDIVCSTCHGVHFTDSDGTTPDGMGNSLVGDGYMLKGDGRTTGRPSTLCKSCHIYESHGASPAGCIDCHSGHSFNNGSPGYFVLRDNVSLAAFPASAPANPGTNMTFNSPTFPWKNAGSGYCENCHTLGTNHNGLLAGGQTECSSCHDHSATGGGGSFIGTGGGCSSCHGYPPSLAPGAAAGYTGDETTAPHAIHAEDTNYNFDCYDCHSGNTHDAGTFQDVGFAGTAALNPGATYVAGTTTCQAVYCHGNGSPRTGAYKPANQNWAGGLNGINDCAACHGNSGATMAINGNSVSHQAHIAKGYSCSVCHNTTAASATAMAVGADKTGGDHVNGVKDVNFDGSALTQLNASPGAYAGVAGTCSSVYCHSDGANGAPLETPDWDSAATGNCGSCHEDTGLGLSGAHSKHTIDTDGPQLSCFSCHTNAGSGADHVNGFVSLLPSLQTAVCNSCHGINAGETAPVWTDANSSNCITCHTGTLSFINTQAPARDVALFFGHNLATGNYSLSGLAAANQNCEDCHDKAATHLTGTGNMRLKPAFSCDTCHGTAGTASVNNINTHQLKTCLTCHDPHGSPVGNGFMIKSASPGNYSGSAVALTSRIGTNSFDEGGDPSNADDICATCHTATTHNRADKTGVAHNEGTDCMTCHNGHTDPTNAFSVGAGTSCDGCHGFPPATAAHAVHSFTTGNTIATSDRSDCAVCHTGADSYSYDPSADINHSDAAARLTTLAASVGFSNTDSTCAKACHQSSVADGTWNDAALNCDSCHYYSFAPASATNTAASTTMPDGSSRSLTLTGTHNNHFDVSATCADCHTVPVSGTAHVTVGIGTDAQKLQGKAIALQDEADILGTVGSDTDPGEPSCNVAACHNPSGTTYSVTWNGPAATCDTCHSSTDPATNNHTAHLGAATTFGVNITCDSCHVDNLANMGHLNGSVDMAGQVTSFVDPNCTNNCHEDGRNGVAAVTATWGMAAQADCTICHTQQPATGSHAKHIAAAATCTDCHDNTVDNTTAAAQHLDLNIDAFDAIPADLGYPADKAMGSAFTTCNAAACHTDGTNTTPIVTPVWGTDSACTECHAAAPATGSHTVHLAATGVACADCHTGTTQGTAAGAGHRDGNIDTAAANGYTQNKAIASAFETCGAASCHDNGLGVAVASPVWGTAVTDCSECHQTQPTTGSHTAHLAGGANCGSCHAGAVEGTTASTQHGDDNLDVTNGYPANVAKGSATWTTCNTASCHNDGQGADGTTAAALVTTPVWGTTVACGECHVAVPASANHPRHLSSYGATCGDCHATAGDGSSAPTANHINNSIDVGGNAIYDAAGAPGNGWGTCNNSAVGCHPSQPRVWDAGTPVCTSCHGASSSGAGEPLVAGDMLSTNPVGQHNTHVNSLGMGCATCHDGGHNLVAGITGQDDKLQISFTGLGTGGTYNPPGTWTAGKWLYDQSSTNTRQDCSNLYCHSTVQADGGVGAPTYATPDWGNVSTGDCGTCHALTPLTGSHGAHIAAAATCNDCHSGNTHANQNIDVTASYTSGGAPQNGYGECSTANCHDDGTGALVITPTWGTASACNECHETAPTTNAHPIHLALGGVNCATCHQGAVELFDGGVAHRDGALDTVAALGYSDATKGAPYGTCATASCHDDGQGNAVVTPAWDDATVANCTACHTVAPATGSHTAHFADGAACNVCHDGAVEATTASTLHLSGAVNIDATPTNTYANNPAALGTASWTTCATANCHVTGQAANAYAVTPAWGVNAPNCSQCHAVAPTTGSHSKHLGTSMTAVACADCHAGAVEGSAAGAGHRDDNIDTAAVGYPANKALGSAFTTCSTASCHDNGLGAIATTPLWGTTVNDCSQCHTTAPATGSHTAHFASGATCTTCHTGAVEGTTLPTTGHYDGNLDVSNGYPPNVAKGNGTWTTCNAASCHSDGQSGLNADAGNVGASLVTTPAWGTAVACGECHVAVPTSAKHSAHLTSYGSTCGDCHATAGTGAAAPTANHLNSSIDVGASAIYNAGGAPGNGWGTCTNSAVGCHPSQTRAWDATGPTCDACHGASSAGTGEPLVAGDMFSTLPVGQHNTHVNTLGMSCAICHDGGHNLTGGVVGQDDKLQISFTGLGTGGTYNPPGTWTAGKWLYDQSSSNTRQDCSNLYCHSTVQADGGLGAPTYSTPDWGNVSTGDCGTCHALTPLTGSHGAHIAAAATCNDCHSGNTHANQNIDVTNVTYTAGGAPQNGYGTCSTANCHDDGTGVVVATPTWGTTSQCNECHATVPTTNAHPIHLGLTGVNCGTCHQGAVELFAGGVAHRDGTLDTVAALGYSDATKGAPYGTCSTASCHDDGQGNAVVTPVWNVVAPNCTACHAVAPTTGSHTTHFNDGAACNLCHAGAVEGTTASTNHLSGAVNIDATPTNTYANDPAALGTASWTTCATANCHTTGQAAADYAVTPAWGTTVPNCTQCHEASPTTGSHAKHIVNTSDCVTCHTGAVINTSYASAAHRDDNVDVALGTYTANKALGAAAESCDNISCHSDGLTAVTGSSPVWGAVTPNCTACHAAAPATGSHPVHFASGASCTTCHTGAVESTTPPTTGHTDGNLDVSNGYPANVGIGSATWATCNAASCHNDGQGTDGTTGSSLVTTPAWGTAVACGECHVAVPSSAKHTAHLSSYGSTCGDCHATAGTGATAPTANHLNSSIDVGANAIYSAAGAPGNGWGTCTNSAAGCHPSQTRNWDALAASCTSCHGGSSTAGEPLVAGDMLSTNPVGQHDTHVNAGSMSCATCHDGGHNITNGLGGQDDKLQISFTGLGTGGTYNPPGTWTAGKWLYDQSSSNTRQDCSNLYCHSTVQADGGVGAPTYSTPDWGNAATGTCGSCHAIAPPTGSHGKHIAAGYDCVDCHNGNTHANQNIDVTSGGYNMAGVPQNGYGTCSAASCHEDGTGTVVTTPTWGTDSSCNECHASAPTTNAHPIHLGLAGVNCATCHEGAVELFAGGVAHRDGTLNTVAALGYSDSTKGAPYGTCSTASCHDDGQGIAVVTPVWNVDAPNCTACHAVAPATGSHTAHFADGAACNVCHDGAVEATTASTLHLSGAVNIDAAPTNTYANDPAVLGAGSWTTCATANCHVTGQAAADYAVTPAWGVDAPNCTQCHEAAPTTGSHAKHITINNDCVTCHTGAVKDVSYGAAAHRDDNVDVAVGTYTANKALGAAAESCDSISCHSDGLTAVTGSSPVWGAVTPNCTACHAAVPATGSHAVHLADGATCSSCHKDAVESNLAPTVIHTDGDVDVFATTAGDLGYPINAAIGSGSWSTCNAAACHDDGTGALVTTPNWGTASTCNECHSNVPTTNAHGTHLAMAGVNCGTCHTGAVQDSNAGASHRNGTVEVLFGYTDTTKGAPYGTCATATCHNNGLGVAVPTPAWNGATTCNSCHNTAPTTGSHSKHLSSGASCGSCHSDAVQGGPAASGVHADSNVNVFDVNSGDLGYPTTAALGSASWNTCNAAACHDDGTGALVTTPIWGATANCTECHAAAPTTGAHSKHLSATISGAISCDDCHIGTTQGTTSGAGHRDGNIDVSSAKTYNSLPDVLGYTANKAKGSAYASCDTAYCHGDRMPRATTNNSNPNWGGTSTGCTFCHDMAPLGIGAHAGQGPTQCVNCHDNTNSTGTGFVVPSLHINGILEVTALDCNSCHSNVGSGLSGAHGAHNFVPYVGSLDTNDYGNAANGWYATSYINDAADGNKRKLSMGCGFCHPSTVAGHTTKQTSLSTGDAGAAGTLKAMNGGSAAYAGGVCSQVYCHSDGAGTFSDSPSWTTGTLSGNCNDCHGNSPTTNAHSIHTVGIHYTDLYDSDRSGVMQAAAATNAAHGDVATSTTITCVICHGDTIALTQNDQNDICVTCHTGGAIKGNLGIASASVTHINGQADVAFNMSGFKSKAQLREDITFVPELDASWTRTNGYKRADGLSHDVSKINATFNAGTCSAIACHNNNNASWTDPVAGNCQKCHSELPQ